MYCMHVCKLCRYWSRSAKEISLWSNVHNLKCICLSACSLIGFSQPKSASQQCFPLPTNQHQSAQISPETNQRTRPWCPPTIRLPSHQTPHRAVGTKQCSFSFFVQKGNKRANIIAPFVLKFIIDLFCVCKWSKFIVNKLCNPKVFRQECYHTTHQGGKLWTYVYLMF